MRVCERCGRLHCAQSKPSETHCKSESDHREKKRKKQGRQEHRCRTKKKEEGKISEDTAENEGAQLKSDDPAALDKLLRQLQERGPAPATMEWIPRTVRPRVTTILTRLISESAQAAELVEGSEWDAIRWRTSMLRNVAKRATTKSKSKKATR